MKHKMSEKTNVEYLERISTGVFQASGDPKRQAYLNQKHLYESQTEKIDRMENDINTIKTMLLELLQQALQATLQR